MKKVFAVLCLMLLTTSALAMGRAPEPNIKSGNAELDRALTEIDEMAEEPAGAREIEGVIINKYSVTQKQLEFLKKRGYRLSEIYYLSLMAKQSGRPVNEVAALHARGGGWGVLAKKLKVQAGDLNRLRVRLHKIRKEAIKEQRREEQQLKIHSPKPVRVKPPKPAPRRNR